MMQTIRETLRSFGRNDGGNIAIMFGFSLIPLLLIMGGAIDFARYTRYKTDLSNAVDSAALALARQHAEYTEAQATTFVTNYVNSFAVGDNKFTIQTFDVDKITNGFHVNVAGNMQTLFLPFTRYTKGGTAITGIGMNIVSEVVNSSNQVELAFVFDNTGSMDDSAGSNACLTGNTRMAGLKCAAKTLIAGLDTEMNSGATKMLKMALVPFEGSVNVGVDTANPPSWISWSNAVNSGSYYEGRNFATNTVNTDGISGNDRVGHKWLYGKLGISWAGCVEMRAEPYDILDTAPSTGTPNTLFVPMFWPDEPDDEDDVWNDYLNDGVSGTGDARQKSLTKYNKSSPSSVSWKSGQKDTTFPYTSGPNRGCPPALTPLTTSKSTIDTAIDAMTPLPATGTFIANGLVWGWHVLSPTEPFTQGVGPSDDSYDTTVKALILMSDGANSPTVNTSADNHNDSTYSGYNYTATPGFDNVVSGVHYYRRLQTPGTNSNPSSSTATTKLNEKTSTLCENVKTNNTPGTTDDDIRLYTITFGSMDSTTTALMTNCATLDDDGTRLYFSAPDSATLEDIFHTIGEDLSEIHLSK